MTDQDALQLSAEREERDMRALCAGGADEPILGAPELAVKTNHFWFSRKMADRDREQGGTPGTCEVRLFGSELRKRPYTSVAKSLSLGSGTYFGDEVYVGEGVVIDYGRPTREAGRDSKWPW